jgi:hypothetical protein
MGESRGIFAEPGEKLCLQFISWCIRAVLEVFVPITVVLAVGLDSLEVDMHLATWKSSGLFVIGAATVQEAIGHFKGGDFDLVLLGDSLPFEKKERPTYLIRAPVPRFRW